ncbi:hybrid sensor histidine kinase/response regulator [Aliterella atlantica]|uniref:histidine kinase n=1 Tax=Aliterella atlantica CENA595 TaxID=1618023 RepID=A0A0D8ZYF6_9CYAN|nr:hybrid sensor histidine kinase/response regulator [Aliterella atlantica]KJH73494.1 hypothetical protein UH38_01620 [Aliterella atlantica CENA595]
MLPEQQQRILGYFIEEAKDHLITIEQGLLNLQTTLQDSEMLNDIFRAAHSIKGGAAMLGLNSIQRTAHRLEDFFKILKESGKIQVDQNLESLLLQVFDTQRDLLEHLERGALTEEVSSALMAKVEPTFGKIDIHLTSLASSGSSATAENSALTAFQTKVPQQLRQMLELFKQPPTPTSRQQLQDYCQELVALGREFDLANWCQLCESAQAAIAKPKNTFRTLAPIIIKELKQAQELVAQDSAADIIPSRQLQILGQKDSAVINDWGDHDTDDLGDLFAMNESSDDDLVGLFDATLDDENSYMGADADSVEEMLALDRLFNETPAEAEESTSEEFNFIDLFADSETTATTDDESLGDLWQVEASAPIEESTQLDLDADLFVSNSDDSLELPPVSLNGEFSYDEQPLEFSFNLEPAQDLPDESVDSHWEAEADEAFEDLDKLLEPEITLVEVEVPEANTAEPNAAASPRRAVFEQMMRVPVKHLDNIGNLVGELVVYRNSLEQDQLRLRQFLDNLLNQVQQLSEVGFKMQELYERSLLQNSLLNRNKGANNAVNAEESTHSTGVNFDALEMDRFTGFHTLTQQMIELIVRVRESSSDIEFVTEETDQVARQFRQVTTHLQEGVAQSRMIPFAEIANRLPRAVRDISIKSGKQAELIIDGEQTLIDKVLLEQLYDPMSHLVNNAIAHGIESPEQREALGKSATGKITLQTFHQGNQTIISISDDGAGIDTEKVKAKAMQKGLITAEKAQTMSDLEAYDLLFHPGFSIKDTVDEFAGRGIGMDVVRTSLSQIRGTISTDSTLGKGTTFTIRLPLTLSICKALCCLSDKARIAFPMDGVEQMLDIPAKDVVTNGEGKSCIVWRNGMLLPFQHLKEILTYNRHLSRGSIYGSGRSEDTISIIVLRSGGTFLAVQVDQVLGEQEIVIKQFERPAPKPLGVAGATVMGDGRIMPIADVLELIDLSTGKLQRKLDDLTANGEARIPVMPAAKSEPMVLIVDDSITVRELLSITFNNAGYRVEQARDGQEAWDKLNDGLPCDIVFCDIEMPRMDGLELLSRIHEHPNLQNLPIAMLTSRGSDRHRQMAVQLGASGYFIKPYLEEALLDAAQRMLKGEVLVTAPSNV